jgi:hypothetical protein
MTRLFILTVATVRWKERPITTPAIITDQAAIIIYFTLVYHGLPVPYIARLTSICVTGYNMRFSRRWRCRCCCYRLWRREDWGNCLIVKLNVREVQGVLITPWNHSVGARAPGIPLTRPSWSRLYHEWKCCRSDGRHWRQCRGCLCPCRSM